MKEIWKDIRGYKGLYRISSLGKVESIERINYFPYKGVLRKRIIGGILLKQKINTYGYFCIALCKNGKMKHYILSNLIGKHFIPNPDNKFAINHKDGNKLNNNINNLEWLSVSENLKHAHRTGLIDNKGSKNPNHKLTEADILQIRKLFPPAFDYTQVDIARIYNVNKGQISCIIKRKTWSHI